MPSARLTDRAVLAVTGPDAAALLQGLVTNTVTRVTAVTPVYAALLTPQGKVQTDFFLFADGAGGFLIDVAAAAADDLLKRLKLYRLRAAVALDPRPDLHVFASWEAGGASAGPPSDPRLPALGRRWIADAAETDADLSAYTLHRLALGVPDTADVAGAFALDANLDELNGLDFRKGCFVGQEVTARMKHKTQPRRRLVPLLVEGEVSPGATVTGANGTELGEIASAASGRALASLRLDRLREAQTLSVDGRPVRLAPLAYGLPLQTGA